jgi:hypothetical protein
MDVEAVWEEGESEGGEDALGEGGGDGWKMMVPRTLLWISINRED